VRQQTGIEYNKRAEKLAEAAVTKATTMLHQVSWYSISGSSARISSSNNPGLWHEVTEDTCSCKAGARGNFCYHRALLLLQLYRIQPGQLTLCMGTHLGTASGGIAVVRQLHEIQKARAHVSKSASHASRKDGNPQMTFVGCNAMHVRTVCLYDICGRLK
jgi:hypothetical protein